MVGHNGVLYTTVSIDKSVVVLYHSSLRISMVCFDNSLALYHGARLNITTRPPSVPNHTYKNGRNYMSKQA